MCYAVLIDEMTSVCAIYFLESILGRAARRRFCPIAGIHLFRLTQYYVFLWLCLLSRLFLKTSFRCWCSFCCLPCIVLCLPSVFSNLELAQAVRSLQGNKFLTGGSSEKESDWRVNPLVGVKREREREIYIYRARESALSVRVLTVGQINPRVNVTVP
jgi:hypothetical protein